MKTFDAGEVMESVNDGSTALCPRCGIDTVLSAKTDSIDPTFLQRMHDCYFERRTPVDLTAEALTLSIPKGE